MYLPKIYFLGGIFMVGSASTRDWAESVRHTHEGSLVVTATLTSLLPQLTQPRTFNTRIGSHAIKQCIFNF